MLHTQWEDICQQCGRCCLKKFLDGNDVVFTRIACFCLDIKTRRCTKYPIRRQYAPDCVKLTSTLPFWLPPTCAYKRISELQPLASQAEIETILPWDNVVSEKELIEFRLEDYELWRFTIS